MSLKLYNSLTRKIEEFIPISQDYVGMYTCGPTVYDAMHIGNLRTFVLSDILNRVLTYNGYKVKSVENITDIDDKIIKRAKEKNITPEELTREYTKYFLLDTESLNILPPTNMTRATDHIGHMVKYIEELVEKDLAYVEKDGSVYFDISKFPNYGRLANIKSENLKSDKKVLEDNYTKDDVQDFALWKAAGEGEISWPSPWGRGRPGWHIECSVMSQEYLGDSFDLHIGGVDLIFPHHENEIAQSEGKTGKPFVNYFVHGAHMLVNGAKMSKSLNNFYTLKDVAGRGFDPLSLRYLYLQTHYRQEMNFTWEGLKAAQNALNNLRETTSNWGKLEVGCAEFEQRFEDATGDDLNISQALAVVWDLVKSNYPSGAKAQSLFKFDKVLGLGLKEVTLQPKSESKEVIPAKIMEMVREREELRKAGRYHLADQLRNKIKKMGYDIEDKDETGQTEVKKR